MGFFKSVKKFYLCLSDIGAVIVGKAALRYSYLAIDVPQGINFKANYFTVNDNPKQYPIHALINTYKVPSGHYKVVIHSGNGTCAEIEEDIGRGRVLWIKAELDGQNIISSESTVDLAGKVTLRFPPRLEY